MRTFKELAKEALLVQDACNLSGVVHSFSRALPELRALLEVEGKGGTIQMNTHPITVLYANKISSLANSEAEFSSAYNWALSEIAE